MNSRFADGVSLLMQRGWKKTGEGEIGETWSKGGNQTQIAFSTEGAEWWRFINGLAAAEGVDPGRLEAELVTPELPRRPRTSARTELDLHLTGPTIRRSEGAAHAVGKFVSAVALAVKEIIKSDLGLGSMRDRLVIKGVQPGSLRVRFLEPVETASGGLFDYEGAIPESEALWRLGQVFNVAEEVASNPQEAGDLASVTALSKQARKALHSLSTHLESEHWTTQGFLRGRQSLDPVPVRMSLAGAYRLSESTRDEKLATRQESMVGTVDGWQWSDGMMRFLSGDGEPIRAAVPAGLQGSVAELIRDPDRPASATFNVTERQTPLGQVAARSYVLAEIQGMDALVDPA